MKLHRMLVTAGVLLWNALAFCAPAAAADTFVPDRPIRMIVPGGAGSPTDIFARLVAREIEKQIGQPVVVYNVVGAAGILGTRQVVHAAPDGYTIGTSSNSYVTHHLTAKEPLYRWPDDFVMVHTGYRMKAVLVVNSGVPVKTPQEFLVYAKANPGMKAANAGLFTVPHIISALYQDATGVKFTDVPYKTVGTMTQAVWSGEADFFFISAGSYQAGVAAGTMRTLALMSDRRDPVIGDLPTMKETGIDVSYSYWYGFILPKGTPDYIADFWHDQIDRAIKTPEVQRSINDQKGETQTGSRKEMFEDADRDVKQFETLLQHMHFEAQ